MTHDDFRALVARPMLAPMLAVTDIPFRRVCREQGAALVTTEMVSMRGIAEGDSGTFRAAVFDPSEQPVSIQLVGADPRLAAQAVTLLAPLHPAVFDLNCGCPNESICSSGSGASLIDRPQDLRELVAAIVSAVRIVAARTGSEPVPVTAKVRMQGLKRSIPVADIARAAEDGGASALTMHARRRTQRYSEAARWEAIATAKRVVSIPVIGNGDVYSAAEAARMRTETGCDGVMIGRGALGTPWIFRDIEAGRSCGIHEHAPSNEHLRALVTAHLAAIVREFGPVNAIPDMRKHVMWYLRQHVDLDDLRHDIFHTEDADTLLAATARFFDRDPARFEPGTPAYHERETAFRNRVLYWVHAPGIPG